MSWNLKNRNLSFAAIAFIVVFTICFTSFFINWPDKTYSFNNDINQYYSYLNALFVDHDLSFKNSTGGGYWLFETSTHNLVPKVTYGIAFFYSPFYLIAKLFASSNTNGYELVFAWLIHFGCILYVFIGLCFITKILLRWFDQLVTALTILILFFSTNLFYYTLSESESVHGILFFLISGFAYHVIQWNDTKSIKNYYWFLLFAGFICLIRPTECILFLFPLLIGVTSVKKFRGKLMEVVHLRWKLLFGVLLFLIPIIPQLIYWKIQSGQFFFFSYGANEGFFWTDPKFFNILFSYRKGWFVYTPVMILSLIGFGLLYKKNKDLFLSILIYLLVNLYLISAWWDWAFGGSFGMRALIHTYVFLVIPLAYFVQWIIQERKINVVRYSFYLLVFFLAFLNMFQSNLYKHGIISYDGMTKEAYWFTFLKKKYSSDDLVYLKTLIKHPDYAAMRKGSRDE